MGFRLRALVADNDPEEHEVIREEMSRNGLDEVELVHTFTVEEAREAASLNFFEVAFVDLNFSERDVQPAGLELLRELAQTAPACRRVLMTKYGRDNYADIFRLYTAESGGGTFVLNKNDETSDEFANLVKRLFGERLGARWTLEDVEPIAQSLQRKKERIDGLRSSCEAIEDEVRAVLFGLFQRAASVSLLDEGVRISLSPMSGGLSSSVVARATPHYGHDARGEPIVGNRCVVKIGPRRDLDEEASRFQRLVQLGIPSEFRVEMIGAASGDALGGICYSFAGGSVDDEILAVDDLVASERVEDVLVVIRKLFAQRQGRWYSIQGPDVVPRSYYNHSFGTVFTDKVKSIYHFLETCGVCTVNTSSHAALFPGFSLGLPSEEDMGAGALRRAYPGCIVHGDLHGGNILYSGEEKVSMIDYANTGFGPRFADGAALSTTIRLRQLNHAGDDPGTLVGIAALQAVEAAISAGGAQDGFGPPLPAWATMARELDEVMLRNFADSGVVPDTLRREMLVTYFLYALSVFDLPWNSAQRMRLISWVSALRSCLFAARDEPGPT